MKPNQAALEAAWEKQWALFSVIRQEYDYESAKAEAKRAFLSGAQWQASHAPAVSVEGERAAEEYADTITPYRFQTAHGIARSGYLAGFQARSPLVELLKSCRENFDTFTQGYGTLAAVRAEEMIAKIDKALGEEK